MKNKILKLTLACTVLLTSVALGHNSRDNWYISASGTYNIKSDSTIRLNNGNLKTDFKNGFGPTLAIGRQFDCFRAEAEFSYKNNKLKSLNGISTDTFSAVGIKIKSDDMFSIMGNLYYDHPLCQDLSLYLGVGAGTAITYYKSTDTQNDMTANELSARFAAQGMVGLSYSLNPCWDIFTGYRHIWVSKSTKNDEFGNKLTFGNFHMNTIEAGLRFKF